MSSKPTLVAALVLFATAAVIALVSLRGEPKRRVRFEVSEASRTTVTPAELAGWIVEGRRDFTVVDLRDANEFTRGHVRGAVSCDGCHADAAAGRRAQQGPGFVDLSKKLVLYGNAGGEPVELPRILANNPNLYLLRGGYEGWQQQILAPVPPGSEIGPAAEEDRLEARKREALRAFFSGERAGVAAPLVLPLTPIRRENAHQVQGAHEGC